MKFTGENIPNEMLESIHGAASEGADIIGVDMDSSPKEIVTAINRYLTNPPKKRFGKINNWSDRALPIGSLWGQQMVREFGWEWSSVIMHEHGDSKAMGVFSKNRSLAIYPWHFVFGCLENNATVTVLLSFNMLKEAKIPAMEENGFQNIMEGIHHIIPPN